MDDAALVAGARAGDREAWGVLYDRYADRLHDHCWSVLRDDREAAAALRDTFVGAARTLPALRDPARLRPWLYAAARSPIHGRRPGPAAPAGEVGTVTGALEPVDAAAVAPVDDLRRLVWDAAAGLPEADRVLLDLHLRQGLDGEELAGAMATTADQASGQLSRLRSHLERSLGALLVARTGRRDCPGLSALIDDAGGLLSGPVLAALADHVDRCPTCGARQEAMVSPLALLAGVPAHPAPAGLREPIVGEAAAAAAAVPTTPAEADALFPAPAPGPPPVAPPGHRPGRSSWGWLLSTAAASVLVVAGLLFALTGADDSDDVAAIATTTTTAPEPVTTTALPTTTTSTTSTTLPATTTSVAPAAPGAVSLASRLVDLGSTRGSGTFSFTNSGGSPLSYVITTSDALVTVRPITGTLEPGRGRSVTVAFRRSDAPEGPFAHRITLDAGAAGQHVVEVVGTVTADPPVIEGVDAEHDAVSASCGEPTTSAVTAAFTDASPATAVLHWDHDNLGVDAIEMDPADGGATAILGPFAEPGTVTYRVEVTDAHGASSRSEDATLTVTPCP